MKKVLIRTAFIVVSVFAVYAIVSATNTASENKKAKTELSEELADMAAKASCCDSAAKPSGCSEAKTAHADCDKSNCNPVTCTEPCCEQTSAYAGCGHASTGTATAAKAIGCASNCGRR